MNISDMILVLQAAERGEQIETKREHEGSACWEPKQTSIWDFVNRDYRIKPKPRMVPLEPSDVPPGSAYKHSSWCGGWEMIVSTDENGFQTCSRAIKWDYAASDGNSTISRDGGRTWSRCEKEAK